MRASASRVLLVSIAVRRGQKYVPSVDLPLLYTRPLLQVLTYFHSKCNGENPCSRCKTRKIDCHFTQRTWASKRSLQDEAASLREQVHRRDRVLDAISGQDASGEDILRMLREGCTYDQTYERLRGTSEASGTNIETSVGEGRHNSTSSCDCETCWPPSTANNTHSPFSFMDHYLNDDTISQPSTISEEVPQQLKDQKAMDPMQSFSWASSAPDDNSSGNMHEGPTIIDPLLWPPIDSSEPLGQPFLNSWTGLIADLTDAPGAGIAFPFVG